MEQSVKSGTIHSKTLFILTGWVASVVVAAFLGFNAGRNGIVSSDLQNVVQSAESSNVQGVKTSIPEITPDLSQICGKSGVSPKSEYLRTHIIEEGESLQSIAEKEMGSITRVSELIALNDGAQNLTAGSTLYLPPENISESTGKLAQVSGLIVRLDNAVWQISYGGGKEGLGIAIPAYYFSGVSNKTDFKLGDCITVFLEDGVKVFTVIKQE